MPFSLHLPSFPARWPHGADHGAGGAGAAILPGSRPSRSVQYLQQRLVIQLIEVACSRWGSRAIDRGDAMTQFPRAKASILVSLKYGGRSAGEQNGRAFFEELSAFHLSDYRCFRTRNSTPPGGPGTCSAVVASLSLSVTFSTISPARSLLKRGKVPRRFGRSGGRSGPFRVRLPERLAGGLRTHGPTWHARPHAARRFRWDDSLPFPTFQTVFHTGALSSVSMQAQQPTTHRPQGARVSLTVGDLQSHDRGFVLLTDLAHQYDLQCTHGAATAHGGTEGHSAPLFRFSTESLIRWARGYSATRSR